MYEAHWSFVRPDRPELPAVEHRDWPRHALDTFVLDRIEAAGLEPSAPADVASLVRRVYLDLIGLPPLPEELDAFERCGRLFLDAAYERLVDRLLASPRYGERWARKWLDLARYADTNGYEKDRDRSIWPYRDWVIAALNADMPFDQFTIEQIAGDMLPEPTIDQHRRHRISSQHDAQRRRRHRSARVSLSCHDRPRGHDRHDLAGADARLRQCHTHKYDPITHTDYYSLMAFLNNADEPEIDLPDAELHRTTSPESRERPSG